MLMVFIITIHSKTFILMMLSALELSILELPIWTGKLDLMFRARLLIRRS